MSAIKIGKPIVRGPLAMFPLFGDVSSTPDYVAGPEAFGAGLISVSEADGAANVPELSVQVAGSKPVLLIEGETILGAKQNRTLNVTVLCESGVTRVPVSCLEAGRWGTEASTSRSGRLSPTSLRARKTRGVAHSARTQARFDSNQADVWDAVDSYARLHDAPSPTRSMEHVHDVADDQVRSLVGQVDCPAGAQGFLVSVGGKVRSLDLFDRPETLEAYWDALVAGAALDAVGHPTAVETAADTAEAFVEDVLNAPRTERPGVGLGTTVLVEGPGVIGAGLTVDESFVHLAAFRIEPEDHVPDREVRPIRRRLHPRPTSSR